MNVLAFGASSSKNSINKQFATYTAGLFSNCEKRILDLNDYEMPIFSIDRELESGIPSLASRFLSELEWADVIVISFAEHNGAYTTAFKNIFDWVSRIKVKMFDNKKLILLSTSGGLRGGQTVLEIAKDRFPRHGGELIGTMCLPSFKENFDSELRLKNKELNSKLLDIVSRV